MRNMSFARFVTASMFVIATAALAQAQNASQTTNTAQPAKQKQASKSHKVWTEDNISTVRTQSDKVIDSNDRQQQAAIEAAAAAQDAAQKQAAGDPAAKPVKKAPLSQAKSAEDAEAKIEWEKRDIQGQEEYISSLEERLSSATPEEKAHLQQLIVLHKQYIADTQKEMQGLVEQKKNFQKNPNPSAAEPPAPVASAEAQPPSQ